MTFVNSDRDVSLSYVGLTVVILYLSTRIIKAGTGHIFALLLAGMIIYKLQGKESETFSSNNEEADYMLRVIGNPSHFHLDVNFVLLFFDVNDWKKRNPNNYHHAIQAVNNVLKIEEDSEKGLKRCPDNYEVAFDQAKTALNLMHGYVYVMSDKLLLDKLKKVLARLQQLLHRHLGKIRGNCRSIEERKPTKDVHSREPASYDLDEPQPYDPQTSSQFDYY